MYLGVEVPRIWIYNNSMMNVRTVDKIEKGDLVSDGFEDGIVVDIGEILKKLMVKN